MGEVCEVGVAGPGHSRDELGVVVGQGAELLASPGQESCQHAVGVVRHGDLVPVRPHLQTDQSHPDVQGPVVLGEGSRGRSTSEVCSVNAWTHTWSV